MAMYTIGGATVEFIESYKEHADRGCYLVRAKRTGHYSDGSGSNSIGEILHLDDRRTEGWSPVADFRADDGIGELMDAAAAAPDGTPKKAAFLLNFYWPRMFDKKGKPIRRLAGFHRPAAPAPARRARPALVNDFAALLRGDAGGKRKPRHMARLLVVPAASLVFDNATGQWQTIPDEHYSSRAAQLSNDS